MGGRALGYGVEFIATIILARLLTPEEFGVVAMAMALIAILNILTDFGFKQALIQDQDVTDNDYSSIFLLNFLIGFFLSLSFFLLAPFIAKFYEMPILTNVIQWLSIIPFLHSLSLVQIAILSKDLDFKRLNIRLIISRLIGGSIGIYLAIKGYGIYALVWQQLIIVIISTILIWYLSNWRPTKVFQRTSIKKLFGFSFYIFLSQSTNQIILRLDELIIGKLFSAATLGFFGRSNSMFDVVKGLSSKSINSVFFPVLSSIQGDNQRFNTTFLEVYGIISFVSFLLAGVFILTGEALIISLYGIQWQESVEIFNILMFKLFTFPASSFLITALLARGYSKVNFYHGLVRKGMKLIAFVIAYLYGFKAFLIASVVLSYISIIYNNIINSYYFNICVWTQLFELISFSIIFAVSLLVIFLLKIPMENLYFSALINSTIFFIVYVTISFFFRKPMVLKLMNYAKAAF